MNMIFMVKQQIVTIPLYQEMKMFVKVVFKFILRFNSPKVFLFVEESFVMEGLPHGFCRINFCDCKIHS